MTKTTERRPGRQLRHGLLLASTALVAPLFITIVSPAAAQQAGGQGGNAGSATSPGGGGGAGQSGNGITIGFNGGNGVTGGGGVLGGAGGIADWGGGGGRGSGLAAGGGGGGAGGAGHVINTDATVVVTSNAFGASGGNGGTGAASNGIGGGGGGGGGGSGLYVTGIGTSAIITVDTGITVQGGSGGTGGSVGATQFSGAGNNGGGGGFGGHGITVNAVTEQVTIVNNGTISGGTGGSGGLNVPGTRAASGQQGSGIIGYNTTIINNATGIIKPGDGAVPIEGTNTTLANNAITITGGTNSIKNAGSINGRIELGGLSTTTVSGAYSNALKIIGGSTMKVEGSTAAGDATGFTTIQNGGTIDIGAGRKVTATGEVINGQEAVIKIGANATFAGGSSDLYNNGTIDVAAGGTFSNGGSINNWGGTLNFNGAGAKMIAGNNSITNWGQINVTAGDVTVTGSFDNSNGGKISLIGGNMSGVTTLNNGAGGTVDVGAGRTLSVKTFTSTAGSTTGSGTINASDAINLSSGTYGTVFAGTGDLTKSGPGKVTLTGENTYSGGTTIEAGILEIGNGGTTGSIVGDVANSGTLAFNRSNNSTFSGNVTGTGNVTKSGAGTLTVTGALSHGGGTTISGGTLEIGNGGTTGSLSGNVSNNGTLAFNRSDSLDFGGIVSGTGDLVKKGTGTLTLTGANTYSGDTKIQGGTLKLGTGGSLAQSTDVDVGAGAVFDVNNHAQTVGQITGAGEIKLGATGALTTQFDAATATFGGAVTGGGSLIKAGTGTLVLTGASTYSGGTTISGGTLQIGNGGTTGAITGDVTNDSTLAFNRSDELTFDGDISGSGKVAKSGAGTLILTGENTYAGGTTINAGTLQVGNGGTSGSITGNVANEGTLAFNRSDDTEFSGVITGSGGLVKDGDGKLTLTGANYFKGDTEIKDGTLQVGNGGTSGQITGNVINDGTLIFNRSDDIDFAGDISGSGDLVKDGEGVLIYRGDATHTGGTTIKNGTLQIGDGGVQGTLAGDVVNDGTLAFYRYDLTFAGDISGSGSLVQKGPGILTLTGSATHTGGTTIEAGTLRIGEGGTTGSISGDIRNDSALVFDRSDDITYADEITGSGSLSQEGDGKLILTGENNYTGGTTIKSGTLQIGNGGTTGSITGNVANEGTLAFDRSDDIEFGGVITGTGKLVKEGEGTLTLTGANYYKGDTEIKEGILQVGNGGTSGQIVGDVINDGTLTFNRSDDIGFGGNISGSGKLIKDGDGVLTIWGDATLTGGTTIKSGTLQIGDGGVQGTLTGDVVNDGTLAFYRYDLTFAGDISGSGLLVQKGPGILTLTGAATHTGGTTIEAGTLRIGDGGTTGSISGDIRNDSALVFDRSDDITYANQITGSGSLSQEGDGKLILTGENSYTGGTTVKSGTLQIGKGGTTGSITGNVTNDATLAFNRSDDMTFGGVVSGTGKLVKQGDNVLTLNGANTYTGDTKIDDGTLKLGAGGSLAATTDVDVASGAILDLNGHEQTVGEITGTGEIKLGSDGELTVDFSGKDATFAGAITGDGSLTKTGKYSKLILTGDSTFTGGTTIDDGILQIGNGGTTGSISGDIVNNALLFFGRSNDSTFDGDISGTGEVRKYDAGVLTFTGDVSHGGGTEIAGGTLKIGNGGTTGSISGDIDNDSILAFDRSDEITFADEISGTGKLVQQGSGTLILTGVNSYGGGTTISEGTVKGTAQSFGTGRIDNDAALIIDQANDASFANAIDGDGSFTKTGAGKLTLNGTSGLTGATTVSAGTLSVAGSLLGSTVTVEEGATLSGNGKIGGLVVAGDGILATGNSIGTLIVEGDTKFEKDSILRVEVDETGKADKLEVTGAVTIEGGIVDVQAGAGNYGRLTSYTILTGKSVAGEFDKVTSNLAFLDASLLYGATSISLELERNNISFGEVARTRNQRATAEAAEKLGDGHGVFDAILDLDEDMARQAFDSLSGEVHASVQSMLLMDSHFTRDAALERLRTAFGGAASESVPVMALSALPDSGVSLWGAGFGSWSNTDSDGNAAGFSRTSGGFIAGADVAASKNLRFGAFAGYTQSSFDASDRDSKGDASSYHAGLYAGGNWAGFGLRAGASYSWSAIYTTRDIDFGGLEESLDGDYTAGTAQVFGEAAYRFGTGDFALEPFAGLAYVSLDTDDVDEDGGAAALAIQGDTQALTFSTLGLRAEGSFAFDDVTLTLRGMGGWRHAEGDLTPLIDVSFGDAPGFSIAGAPIAADTAIFEAGFDLTLGSSTKLGLAYMGEIGRDAEQHSGQASFAVEF